MNRFCSGHFVKIAAVFFCISALPVAADDGAIEINQLCVPFGCFAGDNPGFPIEITQPGSYRLTGNLVVSDDSEGILIAANSVTLDLGGHAVLGSVECTGSNPVCSQTGPVVGIAGEVFGSIRDLTIRNGTVSGFLGDCVPVTRGGSAAGVHLTDLRISNCGGDGIDIGGEALIDSVTIRDVGNFGIQGAFSAVVRNSTINNAGNYGVSGMTCSDNFFSDNGDLASVGEENCTTQVENNICDFTPCP